MANKGKKSESGHDPSDAQGGAGSGAAAVVRQSPRPIEPEPELGPKMRALANDRQRAFVRALFDAPKKEGRIIWAARAAGYGTAQSSVKSLSVIGSRLNVSDPIQAAISEESQRRLRSLAPSAVKALEGLVDNPKHRDHARGIAMILRQGRPCRNYAHGQGRGQPARRIGARDRKGARPDQ